MSRPKLNLDKKEKLNLTVSKEAKEALEFIRNTKQVSISEFVETVILKEYKKLQKSKK